MCTSSKVLKWTRKWNDDGVMVTNMKCNSCGYTMNVIGDSDVQFVEKYSHERKRTDKNYVHKLYYGKVQETT